MHRRQLFQQQGLMGEHPDPTPIEIPGQERPLPLREEMRRYVREQIGQLAHHGGAGDFEDEDDFELDEPLADIVSQYTVTEMAPEAGSPRDDLEGEPTADDRHPNGSEPKLKDHFQDGDEQQLTPEQLAVAFKQLQAAFSSAEPTAKQDTQQSE